MGGVTVVYGICYHVEKSDVSVPAGTLEGRGKVGVFAFAPADGKRGNLTGICPVQSGQPMGCSFQSLGPWKTVGTRARPFK